MNAWLPTLAFIGLGGIFLIPENTRKYWLWLVAALAWSLLAVVWNFELGKFDFKMLPAIMILMTVGMESIDRRRISPIIFVAAGLVASSLFMKEMAFGLFLLMIAEALLFFELASNKTELERKSLIWMSIGILLTYLPLWLGLQAPGEITRTIFLIVICLRSFDWPLRHWSERIRPGEGRSFALAFSGMMVPWTLWALLGPNTGVWLPVLAGLAGFSALGGRPWAGTLLLSLGLSSVDGSMWILGSILWPVVWRGGRSRLVLAIETAILFYLLSSVLGSQLLPPVVTGVYLIVGLLLGRAFGVHFEVQAPIWQELLAVLVSLVGGAIYVVMVGIPAEINLDPGAAAGAALIPIVAIVGWLIRSKQLKLFRSFSGVWSGRKWESSFERWTFPEPKATEIFSATPGTRRMDALWGFLEKDVMAIGLGLGILGAWLIWRLS